MSVLWVPSRGVWRSLTRRLCPSSSYSPTAARQFWTRGGEVWQALRDGLIQPSAIAAELRDIVAPQFNFSRTETDITVWKSVGFAELDLITAEMILNGMS
jgi:ornithine cyclodeaminase/alanine dehydrogenase-like protein (mu-crystallin family)